MSATIFKNHVIFIEGQDAVIATRDYIADRLLNPHKYSPKTVRLEDLPLKTRTQIRDLWDEWWQTERKRFVMPWEEREIAREQFAEKWAQYAGEDSHCHACGK